MRNVFFGIGFFIDFFLNVAFLCQAKATDLGNIDTVSLTPETLYLYLS